MQITIEDISPVEKRAVCIVPAIIEHVRGDIAQLCKRYGVRELALFGSVLRSDFSPTSSDVDAVVNFGPAADDSLARQYFDFKTALERLLSRPVDLVELEAMPDTRLKRIIERTKVPIYATARCFSGDRATRIAASLQFPGESLARRISC